MGHNKNHVVNKNTGELVLVGVEKEPKTKNQDQTVVEGPDGVVPGVHVYDFDLEQFVEKTDDRLQTKKVEEAVKHQEQLSAREADVDRLNELLTSMDPAVREAFEILMRLGGTT